MKSIVEVVQNLLKPYIDTQNQTLTNDKADKSVRVTLPNLSTSKLSFTSSDDANIAKVDSSFIVSNAVLSNPSAQLSDWNVVIDDNHSITVSGTVASGVTTNVTLALIQI